MKLIELARIYKAVNERFGSRFYNAEVVSEHDALYICLEKVQVFTDPEIDKLVDEFGMHVSTTQHCVNYVESFVIYL